MNDTSRIFESKRYAVVAALLDPDQARFYHAVATAKARRGSLADDDQVPGTPAAYADPLMEALLERLRPQVEELTALELAPTYSYYRVYKRGDVLERHTDREACEISVSVCLGYAAERPWPFWIESPAGIAAIEQVPGDGVLYRGMECAHWREAFGGEHAAQVFLHYVDRNGPRAGFRLDGRRALYRRVAPKRS